MTPEEKAVLVERSQLLRRICAAIGETPQAVSRQLGVSYKDLEPMLDERQRAEIDRDAIWWQVSEYLDRRLALIMAARSDLQRALQKDRDKRATRIASMMQREPKGNIRDKRRKKHDGDTDV